MIYFYIRYIILRKGGQSRRKGRVSVKNRVTVTIGGMEYHLLADDDPQYVKKTAELVDRKLPGGFGQPAQPDPGIRR